MTIAEMRAFLVEHVAAFDPLSSDAAVAAAYAVYQDGATAQEPLTLDEVKLNLRVNGPTEDDLITGLIVDAREFVERETGLVLTPRLITETTAQLGRWIDLSSWPVNSVAEVRYPVAGVMTVLATSAWLYSTKRRPVRLLPATFGWGASAGIWGYCTPSLPVEIDVQAGYATPADVPRAATRAMHMLVAHWYSSRQAAEVGVRAAAIEVPFGVTQLLEKLRLMRV